MASNSRSDILRCTRSGRSIRTWSNTKKPQANLILLHGVVSHSEWLAPIADRIAQRGINVFCPDRRGAGLNEEQPGDAQSASQLVDDVLSIADQFCDERVPLHLGGFCWGATYAIHCASHVDSRFSSAIMIAPSVFPSRLITDQNLVVGESAEATETPLVPIDAFTRGPWFDNYIVPDPLKTTLVSPRFNGVMSQMTSTAAMRWVTLAIPTLLILATDDRLSDTQKHVQAFGKLRAKGSSKMMVKGEHGLQFDAPEETADAIIDWISGSALP